MLLVLLLIFHNGSHLSHAAILLAVTDQVNELLRDHGFGLVQQGVVSRGTPLDKASLLRHTHVHGVAGAQATAADVVESTDRVPPLKIVHFDEILAILKLVVL
jgi:hypothetical protein